MAASETAAEIADFLAAVCPVAVDPLRVAQLEVSVPDRWRLGALVRLVIAELGGRAGVPTPGGC